MIAAIGQLPKPLIVMGISGKRRNDPFISQHETAVDVAIDGQPKEQHIAYFKPY